MSMDQTIQGYVNPIPGLGMWIPSSVQWQVNAGLDNAWYNINLPLYVYSLIGCSIKNGL